MIEDNLVLLSKEDTKINSLGQNVKLYEGLSIDIYSDDTDELEHRDNLVASGIVEENRTGIPWTKAAKWLCRIDSNGILHESVL